MRTVMLLRHATAGSPPGTPDADRPLSDAGEREAVGVAELLAATSPAPDLVLCSTATRARETARPLIERRPELDVWFERDLYLAAAQVLLGRLTQLDDDHRAVLVVGHNPGLGQLAVDLCAREGDRARLRGGFAPASLAVLEMAVAGWADVRPGGAALVDLRPRPERTL
jgi:phosphohistidine phosphatase